MSKEELVQFLKDNLRIVVDNNSLFSGDGYTYKDIEIYLGEELISTAGFSVPRLYYYRSDED